MQNIFNNFNPVSNKEAQLMNVQVLAFVGDSVHTLYIRTMLSLYNDVKTENLHRKASEYVKASGQSEVIDNILKVLNEDELNVFKRARNYKTHSQAKNASLADYKKATGFEAILGYLYLTGQNSRLNEILLKSTVIISKK